ncbi:MAG: PaaI family thioesterase [Myxococcales bacterium]|nr:PaaI family thioesterase [Polyangiaceae bacterium]MDW8249675.1 PaaI family thioesterase [Myxococcales bacterium]
MAESSEHNEQMAESSEHNERLERLDRAFSELIPHNRALGLRFVEYAPGEATMRLPYRDELVGDPSSGVLHGGAITALLDATSGAAVFLAMREPVPIATLDLRIDYLRPATPGIDVIARATCYRLTSNVAFVRAIAYHQGDEQKPVAASAGSFMVGTRGTWAFRASQEEQEGS